MNWFAGTRHVAFARALASGDARRAGIDELFTVCIADKGDRYAHQGESRRGPDKPEPAAMGNPGTEVCFGPATCPQELSTKRTIGGANWNVIGLTDLGRPTCTRGRPGTTTI
ncbi:MAG: hypothetical protein PVI86_07875 [Phycisphaerae bacterium]|jgi:hypothetical protein